MTSERAHSAYLKKFEEYDSIIDFEMVGRFNRDGVLFDSMVGLLASEDRLNASIRDQGLDHPVGIALVKSPALNARSFDAEDSYGRWSGIAINVGFAVIPQIYCLTLEWIWARYASAIGLDNEVLNSDEAVAAIQSIWPSEIEARLDEADTWTQLEDRLFADSLQDCGQLLIFARFAPLLSVEYLLLHEFGHIRLGHPGFWSARFGSASFDEVIRQDFSVDDSELQLALELAADRAAALVIAELINQGKSILIPAMDGYSKSDLIEGWAVALILQMMLIGLADSQDTTNKIFGLSGYPHSGFRLRILCDTIEGRLRLSSEGLADQWRQVFIMSHTLICRLFSIGAFLKNPSVLRRINPSCTIAAGPGPYDIVNLYDPNRGFSNDSEFSYEKATNLIDVHGTKTHRYSGLRTDSFTF